MGFHVSLGECRAVKALGLMGFRVSRVYDLGFIGFRVQALWGL